MKTLLLAIAVLVSGTWTTSSRADAPTPSPMNYDGVWKGVGHLKMMSTPVYDNDCEFVLVSIEHLPGAFLDVAYQDYQCGKWEVELGRLEFADHNGVLYNYEGDKIVGAVSDSGFSFDAFRTDGIRMVGDFKYNDGKLELGMTEWMGDELEDEYHATLTRPQR